MGGNGVGVGVNDAAVEEIWAFLCRAWELGEEFLVAPFRVQKDLLVGVEMALDELEFQA